MQDKSLDPVDEAVYNTLLEIIAGRHRSSFKLKNLFTTTGGKKLEDALTDVVSAVYEMHGFEFDREEINTGTQRGTSPTAVYRELTDTVDKFAEYLAGKVHQFLGKQFKKFNTMGEGKFFSQVYRKTDVKGQSVLDIYAHAELQDIEKAMAILDRAKISAKNYSSKGWGDMEDLTGKPIKLGNTNVQRAVTNVLSTIMSGDEANDVFEAMMQNFQDINVQRHLYHMRFIYELTGLGMEIIGSDKKFTKEKEKVDFLVYNDPASPTDIYVKSASELIRRYMLEQETTLMSTFDVTNVDKGFFLNDDEQNLT